MNRFAGIAFGIVVNMFLAQAGDPTLLTVAKNGSGQFQTIQAALDAVPVDNARTMTILIKNGVYAEKLFITKKHVALVGEDRDSTRVVFAELRTNWTRVADNRPDGTRLDADWGSGVVNIGHGASDVTIANMTIHNNYGTLYGSHEHQFTIRGFDATRIALLYCSVISDGGDALSLWNADSGLYYHASCSFEGWVDYVCPRGWCYVTDSKFYGHNLTASIWHDGSANRSEKFVITHSSFDGVQNFPLGRHHRDAQIFLLDCLFSSAIADQAIYSPQSPNLRPWNWGARHYFFNTHRDGGDFSWHTDNLEFAEHAPSRSAITARWTFDGKWDPESTLPAVLPFASIPIPEQNSNIVSSSNPITLRWTPGRNVVKHRIRFGESDRPPVVAERDSATFNTGLLKPGQTYYWQIDEVTQSGTVEGKQWQFKTDGASAPRGNR